MYYRRFAAVCFILASLFLFSAVAFAEYDRHDGSIYSCNEIGVAVAVEKRTHPNSKTLETLQKEYKTYCAGVSR